MCMTGDHDQYQQYRSDLCGIVEGGTLKRTKKFLDQ
jgi:hypothetical protein